MFSYLSYLKKKTEKIKVYEREETECKEYIKKKKRGKLPLFLLGEEKEKRKGASTCESNWEILPERSH